MSYRVTKDKRWNAGKFLSIEDPVDISTKYWDFILSEDSIHSLESNIWY